MFQLKPWEEIFAIPEVVQRHGNRLPLEPKRTQWLMLGRQTLPIGTWRSGLFPPTVLHLRPLSFLMNGQYWTFFRGGLFIVEAGSFLCFFSSRPTLSQTYEQRLRLCSHNSFQTVLDQTSSVHVGPFHLWASVHTGPVQKRSATCPLLDQREKISYLYQ